MNQAISFYYFSGTGNTKLLVDYIAGKLKVSGAEVSVKAMEKEAPAILPAHDLWLAFPMNSQSVSPFIWKFFKSLPMSSGTKVFVVATLNDSACVMGPLYDLLRRKGYNPVSSCVLNMPNNMVQGHFNQEQDQERLSAAFQKADGFLGDVMSGRFTWEQEKKGSRFVSFLSRKTVLPWISMRLLFKLETDPKNCSRCGLCVNNCPVGNIRKDEQYPVHGNQCQFCFKCAAYCPNKAIRTKGKDNILIRKAMDH